MGTGMAFQWEIIRSVKLASGHIVEDLEFGLELANGWNSAAILSLCSCDEPLSNISRG